MDVYWYAVVRDDNDYDYSYGSFDFYQAKAMLKEMFSYNPASLCFIRVFDDKNGNYIDDIRYTYNDLINL